MLPDNVGIIKVKPCDNIVKFNFFSSSSLIPSSRSFIPSYSIISCNYFRRSFLFCFCSPSSDAFSLSRSLCAPHRKHGPRRHSRRTCMLRSGNRKFNVFGLENYGAEKERQREERDIKPNENNKRGARSTLKANAPKLLVFINVYLMRRISFE